MAKEYVPVYLDWLYVTQDLSAKDKGNLIDAVIAYASGIEYEHMLNSRSRIAFRFLKGQVDRNSVISETRSRARGAKKEIPVLMGEKTDLDDSRVVFAEDQAGLIDAEAGLAEDQAGLDDGETSLTENQAVLTEDEASLAEDETVLNNKTDQTETNDNKTNQNESKLPKEKDNNNKNKKEKENKNKNERERGRFAPPSPEEVRAYCRERNNRVNPDQFVDFYAAKGWKIGNQTMKDWKACVRTWEQRDGQGQGSFRRLPGKTVAAQQYEQRDYSGMDETVMQRLLRMG